MLNRVANMHVCLIVNIASVRLPQDYGLVLNEWVNENFHCTLLSVPDFNDAWRMQWKNKLSEVSLQCCVNSTGDNPVSEIGGTKLFKAIWTDQDKDAFSYRRLLEEIIFYTFLICKFCSVIFYIMYIIIFL